MTTVVDMSPQAVHAATLQKLYAALQFAVAQGDFEGVDHYSSAIQRLESVAKFI